MQKGALVPLTHFYIYITLTYLQRFVNHFFNKIFKKYLKIKQEKIAIQKIFSVYFIPHWFFTVNIA